MDQQLKAFGLRVLRTPARAPKVNAYCERLVGSIRREYLDFMIPLGEKHLRRILAECILDPHIIIQLACGWRMLETGTRIISLVVSEKKMIERRIYDEDQQFDP